MLIVCVPKLGFDTCYKNLTGQASIFKLMKSVKSTIFIKFYQTHDIVVNICI